MHGVLGKLAVFNRSDQTFFKPFLNMHTFTKLNKEENISRQAEHQRGIESVNI